MRKTIAFLLCLLFLFTVIPAAVEAVTPIDPYRPSSLTLQYARNGSCFAGLEIRSYRIASVQENGTYTLTGAFGEYPVKIYEVTSQAEWKKIASTLAAYAEADQLQPDCIAVTDANGMVSFTDILPGMYLTMSVTAAGTQEITVFENFLTVVPYPSEDGNHKYDVWAYPKCDSYVPTGDKEYKVVKLWKDSGYEEFRPDSVTVDILRNGVLYASEVLSSDNNWAYRWRSADDGSIWQVIERGIPAEYTVAVSREQDTFVIENSIIYEIPEAPQTGETTVLWIWQLAMGLSGGILLVLAAWRKKNAA